MVVKNTAKNPEIRKAVNTLYDLSVNDRVRAEYEARAKAERDWISGIEGGRLQGLKQVAKNLKGMGLSVPQIAEATGLSQEEITNL